MGLLESLGVRLPDVRRQITQVIDQGDASVGTGGIVIEPKTEPAPLGDLLRVIPIVQTQAARGVSVTLLSLESYAHGFIIHDRTVFDEPAALQAGRTRHIGSLKLDVIDDRGDHYDGNMQFGRSDHHAWYFDNVYRPAVDPEARELRVQVRVVGGGPAGSPESSAGSEPASVSPWLLTFSILLHPEGR